MLRNQGGWRKLNFFVILGYYAMIHIRYNSIIQQQLISSKIVKIKEIIYLIISINSKNCEMAKFMCQVCKQRKAFIKRPKNLQPICQQCFFQCFEAEVHETIINNELFKKGDKIAIGASGGKDSTVVVHVLNKLNKKYDYGVQFYMLAVDQGIKGYRDDSLQAVKRNQKQQNLPLLIVSYKELYGWTMDEIVKVIGRTNNCTYCGVFRRQALQRGAVQLECNKIITGHNADDIAQTVLMNMLRGDLNRLGVCANVISGEDDNPLSLPRVKPLKYTYQKQIVLYAYHKKLDYFSTECIYSPFAYRGHVRQLIKDLQNTRPQTIVDIILSAQQIKIQSQPNKVIVKQKCEKCGFMTSNKICKACILLQSLQKGKAKVVLSVQRQANQQIKQKQGNFDS